MKSSPHLFPVEILRGLAIMSVVGYHAIGPIYGWYLPWRGWFRDFSHPPSQEFLILYPTSFGWTGVSLFFVLSGFCIHLSFLRSPAFSARRFFWHRFWRIVPAYFVALVAFSLLGVFSAASRVGAKQFLTHALFVHNLPGGVYFSGINASFWSIAVEFQLYLLFPFLLIIRRLYGVKGALYITFAIGLLWRGVAVWLFGLPDHLITGPLTFPLMTWFDWTLGVYVAECFHRSRAAFIYRYLWCIILLPAFILSTLYKPFTIFSFALASAISAVFLDWLLIASIPKSFPFKGVAFVGTVSYSLYLWHQPLFSRLYDELNQYSNPALTTLVVFVIILAGAFLSFRIFEKGGLVIGAMLLRSVQKGGNQPNQALNLEVTPHTSVTSLAAQAPRQP